MTKLIVSGMKVPEPMPASAIKTRKPERLVARGARSDVKKNSTMPASNTRRAPNTAPR
jgi:hypothetical protein